MNYDGFVEGVKAAASSLKSRFSPEKEREPSYEELLRERNLYEMTLKEARHDIRNKMNIAESYLEMIEDASDEEDVTQYSEPALDALKRGDEVLDGVGDILEGEEHRPVNLKEEIQKCMESYEGPASDSGIEIELEASGEYPPVYGDSRTSLIFDNLIENTIYHGRGVAEKAVFSLRNMEDERVEVSYEDDGPGMSEELRESMAEFGEKGESSEGLGWGTALIVDILDRSGAEWEAGVSDEGGFLIDMRFRTYDSVEDE